MVAFLLIFGALGGGALLLQALLHALDAVWIGRYLGIPGALLILASFGYSLRKRKTIRFGRPARWLRLHELMTWLGSLLGWLAAGAMLINVVSGLTGKLLLDRSRQRLQQARQQMREEGLSNQQLEERMYWDSLAFDVVKRWRVVHLPITLAFAMLATAHVVAELLFWSWK